MNHIKQLDIRLNKEYFYPGEQIEGKLVIDVVEPFHLNVIHLLVRGKAHCEWKVYISGDRRIIKDDQYFIDERTIIWDSAKEQLDSAEQRLQTDATAEECSSDERHQLEREKQDEEDTDLEGQPKKDSDLHADVLASLIHQGVHEFHFSFTLPLKNIPCSLESRACSVRYHLRAVLDVFPTATPTLATSSATIDAPSSLVECPQGIKYFTLIPIVDCNENKYLNPLFGCEKRWKYCFCCRQQTATLRCILDRNAFCSGETIKLKSFIQNYASETAKLKVRLVQFCEFNAQKANLCGVTKEVQHLVLEYTSDEMNPDEEFELTTNHCLPILPPSIVGVSRLIQLYYTLTVGLEFERSGQDLQMLFPIKIGTKPYTGGANDFFLEYGPCCDHVEGGIYVDPEFANRGSGFWDDDDDAEAGDPEAPPLYRPVYLKVVRYPAKEEKKAALQE